LLPTFLLVLLCEDSVVRSDPVGRVGGAVRVIALMWHDSDSWQNLRHIWSLPFGAIIGECVMAAQVAGGIGMLFPRTARSASVVLCIVYLCFSLACVPDIIPAANIYDKYGGSFFLFFSLLCGATALYAAAEADAARAVVFGQLARFGLGVCAISFTLGQLFLLCETAHLVPSAPLSAMNDPKFQPPLASK